MNMRRFMALGVVVALTCLAPGRTPPASAAPPPMAPPLSSLQAAFDCSHVSDIPQRECEALVTFYTSTSGWWDATGWLATNTPCSWYGITCSAGHVTHLELPGNGVSGDLPAALADLSRLEVLNLHLNYLTGAPLPELGQLTQLRVLDLGGSGCLGEGNFLQGSLPPEWGNLSNLRLLDLSGNFSSCSFACSMWYCFQLGCCMKGYGHLPSCTSRAVMSSRCSLTTSCQIVAAASGFSRANATGERR